MTHHPLHYRRAIFIAALLLAVFAVARSDTLHHALLDVLGVATGFIRDHPRAGMLIFLILAGFSAMLTFFSSSALVPVGVFAWGPVRTAVLLWVGGTIGGIAAYWIARALGRRMVRRLVVGTNFRRYEGFIRTRASWRTILLFRLALQSELPSYLLGLVRYPFPRYLPMILLGELPYVLVMVYLGETFLERNSWAFAAVLLVAIGLTVFSWRVLQREMRSTAPAPRR